MSAPMGRGTAAGGGGGLYAIIGVYYKTKQGGEGDGTGETYG